MKQRGVATTGMPPRYVSAYLRWSLWALLIALVAALLVTLVWLAGRYEASQVQSKLERDTADALGDIRSALTRNVQSLQALQAGHPTPATWTDEAAQLLRQHREWIRLEWRDAALGTPANLRAALRYYRAIPRMLLDGGARRVVLRAVGPRWSAEEPKDLARTWAAYRRGCAAEVARAPSSRVPGRARVGSCFRAGIRAATELGLAFPSPLCPRHSAQGL